MARKRTLSTLDTSIAYEAVGLDLAKEDTAIAAFGPDHEGPYLIDRMPYDKLYELLADMAPTLVAMEPCSGAHQIAEQIQELGHEVMMISGRHVQAWVKDHCNGQKTDLNDAFAILNLAYDRWLTPIRGKTGSVRISVSGEVIPGAAQRGCPLYLRCSMPDLMR